MSTLESISISVFYEAEELPIVLAQHDGAKPLDRLSRHGEVEDVDVDFLI